MGGVGRGVGSLAAGGVGSLGAGAAAANLVRCWREIAAAQACRAGSKARVKRAELYSAPLA